MKSYEVLYERDESGWWVANVPAVRGCHTQGRTIEEARRRVREALGLFVDGADEAELVDKVCLPANARRAVQRFQRQRDKLAKLQAEQKAAAVEAARVLAKEVGLSMRDVGRVLGVSFQRAHQLRHEATKSPGKRAAR